MADEEHQGSSQTLGPVLGPLIETLNKGAEAVTPWIHGSHLGHEGTEKAEEFAKEVNEKLEALLKQVEKAARLVRLAEKAQIDLRNATIQLKGAAQKVAEIEERMKGAGIQNLADLGRKADQAVRNTSAHAASHATPSQRPGRSADGFSEPLSTQIERWRLTHARADYDAASQELYAQKAALENLKRIRAVGAKELQKANEEFDKIKVAAARANKLMTEARNFLSFGRPAAFKAAGSLAELQKAAEEAEKYLKNINLGKFSKGFGFLLVGVGCACAAIQGFSNSIADSIGGKAVSAATSGALALRMLYFWAGLADFVTGYFPKGWRTEEFWNMGTDEVTALFELRSIPTGAWHSQPVAQRWTDKLMKGEYSVPMQQLGELIRDMTDVEFNIRHFEQWYPEKVPSWLTQAEPGDWTGVPRQAMRSIAIFLTAGLWWLRNGAKKIPDAKELPNWTDAKSQPDFWGQIAYDDQFFGTIINGFCNSLLITVNSSLSVAR